MCAHLCRPGTAKSVIADAGVECVRKLVDFADEVREGAGGYLPLHHWLANIYREGKHTHSVSKDGSMSCEYVGGVGRCVCLRACAHGGNAGGQMHKCCVRRCAQTCSKRSSDTRV